MDSDTQGQPEEAKPEEATAPEADAPVSEEQFTSVKIDELPEELQPVYKSLQADYTRKTQTLAEQRKEAEAAMALHEALNDPNEVGDVLRQIADAYGQDAVLEALGFALDDENPDESAPDDPVARLEAELNALKGNLTESEQKRQEEAALAAVEAHVEKAFDELDLSEKEQEMVLAHALTAYPPDDNGMPQITQAYSDFEDVMGGRQKKWIDGKKAPRQPVQGAPGEETIDLSDQDKRIDYMASLLEADSAG